MKKNKVSSKYFGVRLPSNISDELFEVAKTSGISASKIATSAIKEKLELIKKQNDQKITAKNM